MLRKMKENRRRSYSIEMFEVEVFGLANDAGFGYVRRPDEFGRQFQLGFGVESGSERLVREFDAIGFDPWEADFQLVAFGPHGPDLDRIARGLRRRGTGLAVKSNGMPKHIGILDIEQFLR